MSHRLGKGLPCSGEQHEGAIVLDGQERGHLDTLSASQFDEGGFAVGSQSMELDEPTSPALDTFVGGCAVCTGCLKCKAVSSSEGAALGRSVQDVVDAVTGATWSTRNRIMEGLFQEDLAAGVTNLPAFSPPGSPVKHEA